MSIGPSSSDGEIKIKKTAQIKGAVSRAFREPVRYLFYTSLTGLLGGLMFGVSFQWPVYLIIGLLWITVMAQSFNKQDEKNK